MSFSESAAEVINASESANENKIKDGGRKWASADGFQNKHMTDWTCLNILPWPALVAQLMWLHELSLWATRCQKKESNPRRQEHHQRCIIKGLVVDFGVFEQEKVLLSVKASPVRMTRATTEAYCVKCTEGRMDTAVLTNTITFPANCPFAIIYFPFDRNALKIVQYWKVLFICGVWHRGPCTIIHRLFLFFPISFHFLSCSVENLSIIIHTWRWDLQE